MTGLLVSVPSQAVSLSQGGQGQVLIFPYYRVRGGYDTGFSLLNSTDKPKVLTVRFREGEYGEETQAFKVFLAAHDQWTAAITPTGRWQLYRAIFAIGRCGVFEHKMLAPWLHGRPG
ncbi:MAG: hypothetical protein ABWY06_23115 [Pseudomonas sp.]|uniref:hypothetical protein n=1 Tax=Pseudomonas sp. TaxID=306 RepID=UPI003393A687